ncbi:hypothetical protein CW304_12210 [Bacillus sp. UFRGS-B20]|nr:hypothetical protein CW304_12210 [Bacillus sp. UFRGS-B20]
MNLDEQGYVHFKSKEAELLFQLLHDCYEQKSVIVIQT